MNEITNTGPLVLLCKSVTEVTSSMKQFDFSILKNDGLPLTPGSHLSIKYPDMLGVLNERLYSVCDYCDVTNTVSIAVKKENDHGVSAAVFRGLKSGTVVHSGGASGERFGDVSQKSVSLFCSVSGITPAMALLRSLDKQNELNPPKVINLFYSVRNLKDAHFLLELLEFDIKYSWLKFHLFVTSKETINNHSFVRQGRIDEVAIKILTPDDMDKIHYYGGVNFIKSIKVIINGSVKNNPSQYDSLDKGNAISVVLKGGGNKNVYFSEDSEDTVLELLERDGVNVKSMCRSGFCGACKVKLEGGEFVGCEDACGLTDVELAEGYVLTCCSKPQGNMEISI